MKKLFSLLILSSLLSLPAAAFRLSPMSVQFSPNGPKATQVFTLENNGNEKVPIQISATTRNIAEDGSETRKKSDDFVIYPEQVVLLPNEKRNIRVTLANAEKTEVEKAYRLIASQIPVEFHEQNSAALKNGANLNFLIQYIAAVYVTPPGAAAKVKITKVQLIKPKILELSLSNEGNAHKLLKTKNLKILSQNKSVLEMTQVKELESENLLAGSHRTFRVELPTELTAKDLTANIEFEEPSY